jgi:GH25 family lysozyme M1 (1,4-beta-N-acetylmuramidase)
MAAVATAATLSAAQASDFSEPWKKADRALVIDAYEYNSIDWNALASDKRIVGFINKASDGLPPPYACSGNEEAVKLCKALWKRHAVARELFQTRKTVAKALGLEWGAYHLARPGNPVDQANNFIDFAEPGPDDLLALDIEDNDPGQWMSLDDAEEFVRQVHRRIGRFPILYTNGSTARHIADNRYRYRLLSRLPLWYARYKPDIDVHFPKGNWQGYALWQFSAQANCSSRRCPYRVPGTPTDIDVNVAPMTGAELRVQWPFGGLIDVPTDYLASVPVPIPRKDGLNGNVAITYAAVATPPTFEELVARLGAGWAEFRNGWALPAIAATGSITDRFPDGMAEYVASKLEAKTLVAQAEPVVDQVSTGSVRAKRVP